MARSASAACRRATTGSPPWRGWPGRRPAVRGRRLSSSRRCPRAPSGRRSLPRRRTRSRCASSSGASERVPRFPRNRRNPEPPYPAMSALPYGTWPSPLTAATVAAQGLRLGAVSSDGGDVYWIEGRPAEGGRNVIVRRTADGSVSDVIPDGFNARSRVHEYGGGAYVAWQGRVLFSNFSDQRIYVAAPDGRGGFLSPSPITPPGQAWFYADAVVDAPRARLVCVREDHGGPGEPVNTIVAVPLPWLRKNDGDADIDVLASGDDFYATPRVSPDGRRLSWLAWRHPQMPWDGTELRVAGFDARGALTGEERVAGGPGESIYQPGWSPDGELCFASDRDGWWRLYRWSPGERAVGRVMADPPADAEFGRPHWVFGAATWAFLDRS